MTPVPPAARAVSQQNALQKRSRPFEFCSKQSTSRSSKSPSVSELPDPLYTAPSTSLELNHGTFRVRHGKLAPSNCEGIAPFNSERDSPQSYWRGMLHGI